MKGFAEKHKGEIWEKINVKVEVYFPSYLLKTVMKSTIRIFHLKYQFMEIIRYI